MKIKKKRIKTAHTKMRCGREGMRASGGKGGEGGGWEMDRWEIKAAAGSSQEEREEWRRDNWKRKDGARARLHPEGKRSGVEGVQKGGRASGGLGRGAETGQRV